MNIASRNQQQCKDSKLIKSSILDFVEMFSQLLTKADLQFQITNAEFTILLQLNVALVP